jgi:uncharacterized protein (TIGR02996 family)
MVASPDPRGGITALDVRPDGGLLAWGHERGHLYCWDLERGLVVALRLDRSESFISAVRFSPDGRYLATASREDGAISIWDGARVEPVSQLQCTSDVLDVAWSKDSARLLTAHRDGVPRLWDVQASELAWSAPAKPGERLPEYHSATFAANDQLVFGTSDGRLCAWVPETDAQKRLESPRRFGGSLRPFEREVYAVDVSTNGELIVAGANEGGGIHVFMMTGDWPHLALIEVPRPMAVNDVAFSHDGRVLAAVCSDGVVRVAKLDPPIACLGSDAEMAFLDQLRAAPADHAARHAYAGYLEQRGDSVRAEALRFFAGAGATKPEGVDPLWALWIDPATCGADGPRRLPDREPHPQTLGTLRHQDWAPDAIVSSVAFLPPSTVERLGGSVIVSGHFDGAVRFWRHKAILPLYMGAVTLRTRGTEATLIAAEGRGEHERAGVSWSACFA